MWTLLHTGFKCVSVLCVWSTLQGGEKEKLLTERNQWRCAWESYGRISPVYLRRCAETCSWAQKQVQSLLPHSGPGNQALPTRQASTSPLAPPSRTEFPQIGHRKRWSTATGPQWKTGNGSEVASNDREEQETRLPPTWRRGCPWSSPIRRWQ